MEALERRGKLLAVAAIIFVVFWSQCTGVEGKKGRNKFYICPPEFIKLRHSCYFFSDTKATWHSALFACKDRGSNLTVPERWEDRNLRNYLSKSSVANASRWIGGIYDYGVKAWKWGGELREMRYHSFSRLKKISPEQLQWHCIAMVPELLYRWAPRSCLEPRPYICQTKLRKIPNSELKNYRKKTGKINEITVPMMNRETNDVNAIPYNHPKANDLRPFKARPNRRSPTRVSGYDVPSKLSRSSAPRQQRTEPFPGFHWNKTDPESSYQYNSKILLFSKTGLTPQQVKARLKWIENKRDKNQKQNDRTRNMQLGNNTKNLGRMKETAMIPEIQSRMYTINNTVNPSYPPIVVEEFFV